jgi:predicted dehydrogenase
MANSGGLLVHKATHHFDVINWWLDDEPETVYAFGARRFYGPTREARGERCCTCPHAASCEFFVDYTTEPLYRALYFDAEHVDGYHRDACVFSPEIDIYDTMGVTVRYRSGTLLTYSLVAHSPYEGWRATISGTEGRLELEEFHSGGRFSEPNHLLHFFNRRGERITYEVPKTSGVHGGGDERLVARLFGDRPLPDPLGLMADSHAGAMSVLIGAAANQAIATGKPIKIRDLLSG